MTNFTQAQQLVDSLFALGLWDGAAQQFSWHYEGMVTTGKSDDAEALAVWYHQRLAMWQAAN